MRTQVGIVGPRPAGLVLSHLLALAGIDSVMLESRSRDYVEHRMRAVQLSQLRYFTSSTAGMTTIAENYVGLDAI